MCRRGPYEALIRQSLEQKLRQQEQAIQNIHVMRDKLREWDELVRQELFEKNRREHEKNEFYYYETRLDKFLTETSTDIRATEAKLRELEGVLNITFSPALPSATILPPQRPPSANDTAPVPQLQIMTPLQIQHRQIYPSNSDQSSLPR